MVAHRIVKCKHRQRKLIAPVHVAAMGWEAGDPAELSRDIEVLTYCSQLWSPSDQSISGQVEISRSYTWFESWIHLHMSFLCPSSELNWFSVRACSLALLFCLPSRTRRCLSWVAQFRLQIRSEGGIKLSKQCHCRWHPAHPTCTAPKRHGFSATHMYDLPDFFACYRSIEDH